MTIMTTPIRSPSTGAALPHILRRIISASSSVLMSGTASSVAQPNTKHVLAMCNRLKMIRIYARETVTKMVKLQTYRNRTDPMFVGPAMSTSIAAINIKHAIYPARTTGLRSLPKPAGRCLLHLRPKALLDCNVIPSHDIDQYSTAIGAKQQEPEHGH